MGGYRKVHARGACFESRILNCSFVELGSPITNNKLLVVIRSTFSCTKRSVQNSGKLCHLSSNETSRNPRKESVVLWLAQVFIDHRNGLIAHLKPHRAF